MGFDVRKIRQDFPILDKRIHGHPLVYLDNAATTQKPWSVIHAMENYYRYDNANVHRGVHHLSMTATEKLEMVREDIAQWLGAKSAKTCIFTKGATEGINLVARTFVLPRLQEGDEVLVSQMEHHANIIPWQMVCTEANAQLKVIPITETGDIDMVAFQNMLHAGVKFISITHVSHVLGTRNPVEEIIEKAHAYDIPVLVDGAQACPHFSVDVSALDCDFYVFSGHKVYGPTGIGVLWGQEVHLESMPPYQGGGGMIEYVRFEKTAYAPIPHKFEAGTPPIAEIIGLGAAIRYIQDIDMRAMQGYEDALLTHMCDEIAYHSSFRIIGNPKKRVGLVSFVHPDIHPHDIGTILDSKGIASRTGHHCAMPLMEWYNIPATVRFSLGMYNTEQEIALAIQALHHVEEVFACL